MAGAWRGREPDERTRPIRPPEPKRRGRRDRRTDRTTHVPDKRVRDRATRELGRRGDRGHVPAPRGVDERTVTLRTSAPAWPAPSRRTRVKIFLRDLDRRVLPPIASLLTRFARSGLRSRRIGTALAAVAVVTAVVLAVYTATRPQPRIDRPQPTVSVGVRPGASIPEYKTSSQNALRALIVDPRATRGVYALVSFDAYLDPVQVTGLLRGVKVAEVFMRAAEVPPGSAKVVQAPANDLPGDLDKAMRTQAVSYATIADDLGTLIGMAAGDSADNIALREKYAAARTFAEAEAAAYRGLCPCVFAAVVFARPAILGQLAKQEHVRVVDPFDRGRSPDPSTYSPPVPEQTGTATPLPIEDDTSP